jgi:alpha-1,2-mannosyltransferase
MATSRAGDGRASLALARRALAQLRSGQWLGRRRILGYAAVLLAIELLIFLILIAGTHGWIVPLEHPTTTDFVSFYAAGRLADAGTPALAYDLGTHYALEQQITAPGIGYQFFYYPPVFLLLCAAVAPLPYLVAFVLFEAVTLALYLLVARRILGVTEGALVPLLAFPAVFWTLGLGQNSFLTAALFGAAMLLVDRRPLVAGLLLGALCYKPHFGLLVPVALAAGGHWRAFAAAAVAVTGLIGLSLALFGWETWVSFLASAAESPGTYETGRIDLAGMVSPFAATLLLGGKPVLAYLVQLVASGAAAGFVAAVWHRQLSLPLRAAALTAATLIAIPVVLLYDLMLAGVALLWLVRAARDTGFLAWEKIVLVGVFIAPLVTRSVGVATHVPAALLATLALLVLVAVRARRETAQPTLPDATRLSPALP